MRSNADVANVHWDPMDSHGIQLVTIEFPRSWQKAGDFYGDF